MSANPVLTSSLGILSTLDEDDQELQVAGLDQLHTLVDRFWAEISSALPKIESFYEDEKFPSRDLAAIVASKVFYHLEEYDDALKYALGANDKFDVSAKNEFVDTIISKCIDRYIAERIKEDEENKEPENSSDKKSSIDGRLTTIVERMFERCFQEGQLKEALGIALESRRLDIVRRCISEAGGQTEKTDLLSYAFHVAQRVIQNRMFRRKVLRVLVELFKSLETPDYVQMCQCLLFLDDHASVAEVLDTLMQKGDDSTLMAYQVAFDLSENQNQPFLIKVCSALQSKSTPAKDPNQMDTTSTASSTPASNPSSSNNNSAAARTGGSPNSAMVAVSSDSYEGRMSNLKNILNGEIPVHLYLHFLFQQNKTDLNILKVIQEKLEQRNSVTHNATVMSHAIMYAGTTVDAFLRNNLEWLGRATNWAKFVATASIGVIHKGHHKESNKLLEQYLPQNGSSGSPYQEGGALYAMGLIHGQYGQEKLPFLLDALRNAGANEIVQHGACLGVGLTGMATHNLAVVEQLKGIIQADSAVAGEAAGYAMGLVLLGSNNGEVIQEMLSYAHETQHEKIIRGLAFGIALAVYGQEEEADVVIEQLSSDKDALLRYGGMYAIGMAYACTANNRAIQKLLHVAVSDVNDEVRRAAVTCLGFVMANQPEQVPRVVQLLAESYNPHVRYGAAMAIGIACAGGLKGRKEALNVLEPLLKDRVDYVRQAAFIAMAMVCIEHNEKAEPKSAVLRKAILDAMNVKADTMTKLGAIIAAGVADAGGRNVTLTLQSQAGHKKMAAIVGVAIFCQFWFWYPLVHFISLAFSATAVIGLNKDLEIPKPFTFISNASPSQFAYPPPQPLKPEEKKKTVKHATLSVTAKAKALKKKKDEEKDGKPMDVEGGEEKKSPAPSSSTAMDVEKKDEDKKADGEGEKKEEKKEEKEPSSEELHNPARVTWDQQRYLDFSRSQRYQPIKATLGGFVMLKDTKPDEAVELVKGPAPKVALLGISEDEPEPPAPFELSA